MNLISNKFFALINVITKGGDSVSSVPEKVTLETFVRGANLKSIEEAEKKVDFCFHRKNSKPT